MSGLAASLKNVAFRYSQADEFELKGISIDIPRGDFLAVMGGNGSGKTTLLKLIVGLLKPTSGEVIARWYEMGFVFQNPDDQLFMPTVSEDVAYAPLNMGLRSEEIDKRVADSMEAVGIAGLGNRSIHQLSEGQKKRTAIAGVLAMGAKVLVLDEPTSGLDPTGTSSFMKLLKDLNETDGITVIMSTHDVDLVPVYAKSVLILKGGRPAAAGAPREVLARPDVVRGSELRLPRVAHLAEVMHKCASGFFDDDLPLTIGQAKRGLMSAVEKKVEDGLHDGHLRGGCG